MDIILPVGGGLGLFLYGMNLMGMGLQKVAGERLKRLLEVLTNNRIMGVIVGALVTMIMQSSSATTIMVIGFVNAGLMSLIQAVGVIMGANLGTTITSQLIAFKITDYAPLTIMVGVAIWIITSKKRLKSIAEIFIGFGILFIGLNTMSNGLAPLAEMPWFSEAMLRLNNPYLGVLVGIGLTTLIQSSSASIGLLQALASQGLITIDMAVAILFGDNIGTTTTALLSSIGANKTAKRAALVHFMFNLIGTIIFVLVLRVPVVWLVGYLTPDNISRQVANSHTFFNLINIIIQLPFAGFLVYLVERLIPGDIKTDSEIYMYLDRRILETPSIAIGQAKKEVIRMGNIVEENIKAAAEAFRSKDQGKVEEVLIRERLINDLEKEIVKYLVELSNAPLSDGQHNEIVVLINIVNDLERIGDHAENIVELTDDVIEGDLQFSDTAYGEFDNIIDKTLRVINNAVIAYRDTSLVHAKEAVDLEDIIDDLEEEYRSNHINRLNKMECEPSAGVVFLDVLSNLERVSDHSANVALYVLDNKKEDDNFN